MKCDVCGKEVRSASKLAFTDTKPGEDSLFELLRICGDCRVRILRDCTHDNLDEVAQSLVLGCFQDTVASR